MADSKLSDLSAAASLASTDLFYVVKTAGSGGVKATLSQLNTLYAGLGANTFTSLQTITVGAANTGVLASTGYSLTGSDATSMVNLAGTWNTSGTPTAIKLNVTDTASNASSLLMDLQVGGTSKFSVSKAGSIISNGNSGRVIGNYQIDGILSCYSYIELKTGGGVQAIWNTDAQHISAFRNGVNAQTLRVYNTYTDASNYERGVFDWTTTANTLTIGVQKAGTGSDRALMLNCGASQQIYFGVGGTVRWMVNATGSGNDFGPNSDKSVDIGNTGARVRSLYLGQSLTGSSTTGAIDISSTWNTSGTPTMINITLTDTASNAASMLIKAVVGSATVFGVDKSGKPTFGTHSALAAETVSGYITIVDAGGTTRKLAVVS